MNYLNIDSLASYWSFAELGTNLLVFMNIFGALILGLVVGYERSYHGRAAGMRTYGLVCMASAALTAIFGYPEYWYGGHYAGMQTVSISQVIQGIVTGVGFLGAGVIMQEGFSISGLTTAASIWASSAIGILVGVGFYPAAILLTLLSAVSMLWLSKLEGWLPSRPAVAVTLRYKTDFIPRQDTLRSFVLEHGYLLASGSISINFQHQQAEWRFVVVVLDRLKAASLTDLANSLTAFDGIDSFTLAHARN